MMDLPSEETGVFWHYAQNTKNPDAKKRTNKTGKWMIFPKVEEVDMVWERIKNKTIVGDLGISAKVATARPNALARDKRVRLICVYTYDCEDKEDVLEVRRKLTQMGFKQTLYYKPDSMTSDMKYGKNAWSYKV